MCRQSGTTDVLALAWDVYVVPGLRTCTRLAHGIAFDGLSHLPRLTEAEYVGIGSIVFSWHLVITRPV